MQQAAAIQVPQVDEQAVVAALRRFADSIYLTQTVEKTDEQLTRFLSLEDAFEAFKQSPHSRRE